MCVSFAFPETTAFANEKFIFIIKLNSKRFCFSRLEIVPCQNKVSCLQVRYNFIFVRFLVSAHWGYYYLIPSWEVLKLQQNHLLTIKWTNIMFPRVSAQKQKEVIISCRYILLAYQMKMFQRSKSVYEYTQRMIYIFTIHRNV